MSTASTSRPTAGTHVASTRQIGEVRIVKVENKGKGFRRVRISLPA